jgi:hypothetical protein
MFIMMMMIIIIIIIIIIVITHSCTVIQEIQKHWGKKFGGLEIIVQRSGSCQWEGFGICCCNCTVIMLWQVHFQGQAIKLTRKHYEFPGLSSARYSNIKFNFHKNEHP